MALSPAFLPAFSLLCGHDLKYTGSEGLKGSISVLVFNGMSLMRKVIFPTALPGCMEHGRH